MRIKLKMKMNSTIQDLIAKIRQYTRVAAGQKIFLWRLGITRARANSFSFVSESDVQSQNLFRPKRDIEVFYLRLQTQEEKFRN